MSQDTGRNTPAPETGPTTGSTELPVTPAGSAAPEPGWWHPERQDPQNQHQDQPTQRIPGPRSESGAGQVPSGYPSAPPRYPVTPPGYSPPSADAAAPAAGPSTTRRTGMLIAVCTVAALVAGAAGGVLAYRVQSDATSAIASPTAALTSLPASGSASTAPTGSVEQVAATVLPSVVSVLASSSSSSGEGSGVILSADGLILTNNHVIDGATSLEVQFNDGSTATATVVGADSTDDLAVIKAQSVSGLIPATLGSSADLQVGQGVVAVGSPLGLSATVTSGIVSALNRPVATSDASQQDPQQLTPRRGQSQTQTPAATQATVINAIQTDAAINPGNSGGALVNMSGKVIGINSAIASLSSGANDQSGSIGVGFAIPIDQAKRISDEIIATGKASHAVLGASVADATLDGNPLVTTGATISAITAGGGAAAAGLQVGDVITKLGDLKVESADALVAAVRSTAPDSAVDVTYTRAGAENTVSVTLGSSTG